MLPKAAYNYDSKFDVLYVAISDKSNSYGDESNDAIMLMRDIKTDTITGFTIFNLKSRMREKNLMDFVKTLGVDLENDIVPHLHIH